MPPRIRVTLTMEPAIHKKGKELAEGEHRTFSNYLETLILRDSKGGKPPKKSASKRKGG